MPAGHVLGGTTATVSVVRARGRLGATSAILVIVRTTMSAIGTIASPIPKTTTARCLIATDTIAGRDALDTREGAVEATGAGGGNIAEAGLCILVDACGETVETQVGG